MLRLVKPVNQAVFQGPNDATHPRLKILLRRNGRIIIARLRKYCGEDLMLCQPAFQISSGLRVVLTHNHISVVNIYFALACKLQAGVD